VWRGLSTIAGSWIGGSANQLAMKEVFKPSDRLFSAVIAVDVILAYLWMAVLLYGAGIVNQLDKRMGADTSAIDGVRQKIENYRASIARIPNFLDWVRLVAIAFIPTGIAHLIADAVVPWIEANAAFLAQYSMTSRQFWIVIITTTFGLLFSFTKARQLEGVGASRLGTLLLYMLVVVIGMRMNLFAIADRPGLLVVGAIWLSIHAVVMLVTGPRHPGTLLFHGRQQPGAHRRAGFGPGGGVGISPGPGAGGRAAGHPGLRGRHLWGLPLRPADGGPVAVEATVCPGIPYFLSHHPAPAPSRCRPGAPLGLERSECPG
jgi:hypothetical protein